MSIVRRLTVTSILALWVTQFVLLTLSTAIESAAAMNGDAEILRSLPPRAIVTAFGIAASFAIARVIHRLRRASLGRQVVATIAASAVGCLLHALVNWAVFDFFLGTEAVRRATAASYVSATTMWFWTYATVSAMLLSLSHVGELRERDRRLAELRHVAQDAQLAALRYQLHPHFMFNTLNAIATLIGTGDAARAEHMVEDLAEFLRATLTLRPNEDIPLRRELELQAIYMNIETQRFPDRLHVEYDVPPALLEAAVPSLLLQPLVENIIKHAVRRSTIPIEVRIAAAADGPVLRITVSNSHGDAPRATGDGAAIGLANVARRIELRYPDGRFAVRDTDAAFVVEIAVPYAAGSP